MSTTIFNILFIAAYSVLLIIAIYVTKSKAIGEGAMISLSILEERGYLTKREIEKFLGEF